MKSSYQRLVLTAIGMLLLIGLSIKAQFTLESKAFEPGGYIPKEYAYSKCGGNNWPPALRWRGIPAGTRSFALIVSDPDARDRKGPGDAFIHWVIFNIPSAVSGLGSSLPKDRAIAPGMVQGTNSFGMIGYDGPCPPSGTHRYIFTLYALDRMLELQSGISAAELEKAMNGHVLNKTTLIGRYSAL